MGWTHDTGYGPAYDHEGYGRPVLDLDRLPEEVRAQAPENLTEVARRFGAAVSGWRTVCTCGWASETVHSRADHPAADGAAYLASDELDHGPIHAEWRAHLTKVLPELAVHDAVAAEVTGRGPVEAAVRQAREAGASWALIGRAAGITRQTAHQRWAHLEDDSDDPEPRSERSRSSVALLEHALASAVSGLEELGPVATARRDGDSWRITVADPSGAVLGTAVLASARWAPASAGHRLIEQGWMPSSAAVFVRGRMGGWREREDGSWTVPVTNDL